MFDRSVRGLAGTDKVPGQAYFGHEVDEPPRGIEFEPAMSMLCASLVCVMIVVPAFAESKEGHPPGVCATVTCLVVPIPPLVAHGVHGPGNMEGEDRSDDHAPGKPGCRNPKSL